MLERDHRSSSALRQRAGLEVSRRSPARAPQPPGGRVPPVVEEGALRPSRTRWPPGAGTRPPLIERAESPWVCLEAPSFGNEDGVMPRDITPGKPSTRRYSQEEKDAAVRMVRTLRAELGTDHRHDRAGGASSSATGWSRCGPGCVRPRSTRVTRRVCPPMRPAGSRRWSRRTVSCVGPTRSCGGQRLSSGRSSTANSGRSWSSSTPTAHEVFEGRELGVEPICRVLRQQGCRWPPASTTRPRAVRPRPGRGATR